MSEAINPNPLGIYDALRTRHETKRAATAIVLTGRPGEEANATQQIGSEMVDEWLNLDPTISDLLRSVLKDPDNEQRAMDAYRRSLGLAYVQEVRTGRMPKDPTILDLYTENVALAHAIDFFTLLRNAERTGLSDAASINAARYSHKLHSDVIPRLRQNPKFEGVPKGIIAIAARYYPSDPEDFLNNYIIHTVRLAADPRYNNLDRSVINRAVIGYLPQAEAFLDEYKVALTRLIQKYGSKIEMFHIKQAALNYPKKSDTYLDGILAKRK